MSGHSKWSTIKRQKAATDKKRGAIFTKLVRAITVAVGQSGGDSSLETNFKLRLAIDKAKAANMPKENIKRAIDKGTGKGSGGENIFEEITYEAYGPAGIGIIIQATTDNKQRTGQELRNIFEQAGGSLATSGSVSYNFTPFGQLLIKTPQNKDAAILKIIDLGAEDVEAAEDGIEVFVLPQNLSHMQQKLKGAGFTLIQTELIQKPKTTLLIKDLSQIQKITQLLQTLENHSDVQQVFANADFPQNL